MYARLFWLIVLVGGFGFAHAQSPIQIDSLPDNGLLLRSGWRWHPGDQAIWASPDFDDRRWSPIHPIQSIDELPDFQRSPLGWLRITVNLDAAVVGQSVSMELNQYGASELYLDGKLLVRLGRVGKNYAQQRSYTPATWERYLLPPLTAGRHVIAVRLSQHRPPGYVPRLYYQSLPIFFLKLVRTETTTSEVAEQLFAATLTNYMLVGIFFMLGAIHFLYFYYRRQRINLIFGLTAASCSLFIALLTSLGVVTNLEAAEWMSLAGNLMITLFMTLLLAIYYVYLGYRLSWLFWLIAVGLFVSRLLLHYTDYTTLGSRLYSGAVVLLFIDGLRVSIRANRAGRPNARLVLGSSLALLLILVVGGFASGWLSEEYPTYAAYWGNATNLLFFVVLPISFAIILAREYAQTNRSLEARLDEVEQLSAEKESILKSQNETLERQVADRTAELRQSLAELRSTQQQLVQREKMASLGELTAGIAHEIQNPLNFVNNFAEVSGELVTELEEERAKEPHQRDDDLEAELLADLRQNLAKINQHGGRASGIVRSMLDHARNNTGQPALTNLNALADEYLKLSYHGLRAAHKDFNAQLIVDLQPDLPSVAVVPQEVGRVLLNLFNNAFHAVRERQLQSPVGYQPAVTVQTRQVADRVEIRVSDNGTGVPSEAAQKIFQPFFTTKPTGQGTGLGLSISYDIITKGYGGVLSLESTSASGTTFVIQLPIQQRPGADQHTD
ncbi:signal transduction histidine kinase [Spirosoma lacussanchae]